MKVVDFSFIAYKNKEGKNSYFFPISKNIKKGDKFETIKKNIFIDLSCLDEITKKKFFNSLNNEMNENNLVLCKVQEGQISFQINNKGDLEILLLTDFISCWDYSNNILKKETKEEDEDLPF